MDGRIKPVKVLRKSRFVIVTKFVMITNSFGIIIKDKNNTNTRFFPLNSNLANANAARIITISITAVVTSVNKTVLAKYFASGTAVNAST